MSKPPKKQKGVPPGATSLPRPSKPDWKKIPTGSAPPGGFDRHVLGLSVRLLDLHGPFGWSKLQAAQIEFVLKKLQAFETMTISEIYVQAKKQHHAIPLEDLCKEALDRLRELKLDEYDRVHTLRLGGTERIYGLLSENVLYILWWDPDHQVCPSTLKNT